MYCIFLTLVVIGIVKKINEEIMREREEEIKNIQINFPEFDEIDNLLDDEEEV